MTLIVTHQELLDAGTQWRTISQMIRCCVIRALVGVYVIHRRCDRPLHRGVAQAIAPSDHATLDALASTHAHIRAAAARGLLIEAFTASRHGAGLLDRGAAVFSHLSAAHLHGLAPALDEPPRVEVLRPGRTHRSEYSHLRALSVPDDQIVEVQGSPATSVPRTLIDIARTRGLDQAVPMADAAVRSDLLEWGDLAACLREDERRRVAAVDDLIRLVDGLHESAGESILAVRLDRAGLLDGALPQHAVFGAQGFIARVDFAYPAARLAIEFDGYGKYFFDDPDGRAALKSERRREAALRTEGWEVIRVEWRDLFDPAAMRTIIARIRRHLARAAA